MKQVWVFYLLACGISWLIWLPLYGPALGIHGLPIWPWHHATGGLGPLVAAVLTSAAYSGTGGIRQLVARSFIIRRPGLLLIALVSPLLLLIAGVLLQQAISGQAPNWPGMWQAREFPEMGLPTFFAYNMLFFGFGEETGWRGFLLPRLQDRLSLLKAALVTSLFWALWHLPLFAYRPGYMHLSAAGVAGWFFSLLTGSVLLSWFFNTSRGSILVCAIFHTTVDLAFTSQLSGPEVSGYVGMMITLWGIATAVFYATRHRAISPAVTTTAD